MKASCNVEHITLNFDSGNLQCEIEELVAKSALRAQLLGNLVGPTVAGKKLY